MKVKVVHGKKGKGPLKDGYPKLIYFVGPATSQSGPESQQDKSAESRPQSASSSLSEASMKVTMVHGAPKSGGLLGDGPVIVQHSLTPDSSQPNSSENLPEVPEDFERLQQEAFDRTLLRISGLSPSSATASPESAESAPQSASDSTGEAGMKVTMVPKGSLGPGPLTREDFPEDLPEVPADFDEREREALDRIYSEISGLIEPDPDSPRGKARTEWMRANAAQGPDAPAPDAGKEGD